MKRVLKIAAAVTYILTAGLLLAAIWTSGIGGSNALANHCAETAVLTGFIAGVSLLGLGLGG